MSGFRGRASSFRQGMLQEAKQPKVRQIRAMGAFHGETEPKLALVRS